MPDVTRPDDPHRLGWLAGIIDGEGSIMAYFQNVKLGKGRPIHRNLACWTTVTNTNVAITDEVSAILTSLGVRHYLQLINRGNAKWKPQWRVSVQGLRCNAQLLSTLLPHLIGKRQQAETVIGMWRYRQARAFGGKRRMSDDDWLEQQLLAIKVMNRRGPPAEAPATTTPFPAEAGGKESS